MYKALLVSMIALIGVFVVIFAFSAQAEDGKHMYAIELSDGAVVGVNGPHPNTELDDCLAWVKGYMKQHTMITLTCVIANTEPQYGQLYEDIK